MVIERLEPHCLNEMDLSRVFSAIGDGDIGYRPVASRESASIPLISPMPPFTLTFEFDGLCLFVHRRKSADPALYLLMLNTVHAGHGGGDHEHEPVIDMGDGKGFVPLIGDHDWRNPGALTSGAGPAWKLLLPLSTETDSRVPATILDSTAGKDEVLITKVRLPIPVNPAKAKHAIEVGVVRWFFFLREIGPAAGTVELSYTATDEVTIFGQKINTNKTIVVSHRPRKEISKPPYKRMKRLGHAKMYRSLFPDAQKKPTFALARDIPALIRVTMSNGVLGVDPVVCTLGGGCSTEDDTCDDH